MSVHTLVLTAFIGHRPAGFQAAHRDGDRANNSLDNLEWASPVDNNADKRRHGTLLHGEAIASSRLTHADVEAIRAARRDGAAVASLAVRYGVCRNTIGNALCGRTWATSANPAPLLDGPA
jgi:flavin-binding protein dodecin